MVQGVWSGSSPDVWAHDDSALAEPTVTVTPREIKDVLYNPGMGLADFHFGFEHPPSMDQHPRQTVAYFRWSWADLEPEEGRYAFDFVDRIITSPRRRERPWPFVS